MIWWLWRSAQNPIPFRTRPLNTSAPMVLCLKARESRSPPDLTSLSKPFSIQNNKSPRSRNAPGASCVQKTKRTTNKKPDAHQKRTSEKESKTRPKTQRAVRGKCASQGALRLPDIKLFEMKSRWQAKTTTKQSRQAVSYPPIAGQISA